jgi:16S rRNA (uracil1498-N3)-methyltransferase
MQIFYTPDIRENPELPEEEARHALRVLRLSEGDMVWLTDGEGFFYKAIIQKSNPKHCEVNIVEQCKQPPLWDFRLHIAVAPTKNMERIEWFCEKATEIGIDMITLLSSRFSERRGVNIARLEKILISAIKQSEKATLPKLNGITDFCTFIARPFDGQTFIAHCEEGEKTLLQHCCRPRKNVLILIGPEGDFSPKEIKDAAIHGFEAVSLGKSRLRTETAALLACHTAHVVNSTVIHEQPAI